MEKYILDNKNLALETFKNFQCKVVDRNILEINGNIPVLNVPGVLKKSAIEKISLDCKKILDIIIRVTDYHIQNNSVFFEDLGLDSIESEIFKLTYGDNRYLMSRCDLMIDPLNENYKFLEFNVDSSVGGIEIAQVNNLMLNYDFYSSFFENEEYYFIDPLESFCKMLQNIKMEESEAVCNIAIIDSDELIDGYIWSLNVFKSAIESYGFNVVIGSFSDLEEREDCLFVKNNKIDLVYRVFLNDDVKENYDLISPILNAYKMKNVKIINGLHTELYSSKYIFSLLHDKTSMEILTTEEADLVNNCVPKSLYVNDYNIDEVGLNRNNYVLKPIDGYGGKGIHLGWHKTKQEWSEILNDILVNKKQYIAQERINYKHDYNYFVENSELIRKKCRSTWGVYIFDGEFSGVMYRGKDTDKGEIVNAAQGAGMTASFIYNDI